MMKTILVVAFVAVACLAGCGKQEEKVPSRSGGPVVLKVSVLQSGKIMVEGSEISLADLDKRLAELKNQNGVLWYYRENGQGEPPPAAMEVIHLVVQHRLPISMSSKPDFSDTIDDEGNPQPRK